MCMLLKLNYAKFDVSKLFHSKVIEEKHLRVGSTLVKERLKQAIYIIKCNVFIVLHTVWNSI